jgi:hypothetical protein
MKKEPVAWVVKQYINAACGMLLLQSRLQKGEVKLTKDKEPENFIEACG